MDARGRIPGARRTRSRGIGALLVCLLGACDAGLAALTTGTDRPARLEPGRTVESVLDLPAAEHADFVVDVPDDATALRFDLVASGAELGLHVRQGAAVGDGGEDDVCAWTDAGRATILVSRFSDPAVARGRWHARVDWDAGRGPRGPAGELQRLPFEITARVWTSDAWTDLVPGTRLEGAIAARGSGHQTFRVAVPAGSPALRIDVLDADGDLDLFAHAGAPFRVLDGSVVSAENLYGRESLVVRGAGGRPVEEGAWFVDVVEPWDDGRPARFTLLATLDAEPPAELLRFPVLPGERADALPELARALCAVVELAVDGGTGSGTLVGADGWILTNAHVVERLGGGPVDDVVVSVPLDPSRPAVELFRGRVERFDEERDLALVRIVNGFYGQPLPEGYRFPTVAFGASEAPAIGSTLWMVGYPATGGEGSRVTISATRGVVSGFELGPAGTLLKTDAEITVGNSGGAALDAAGRLIGVPSSTVESGSGQIGYVRPIALVPEEWRVLVTPPAGR